MGYRWTTYKIEDIAIDRPNAMSTGPFGSAISSKYFQDSGIPVIRGGNLSTEIFQRMSDDGLVFVSKKKAKEFKRSIVRPGDLIFTCWGTINQVGLITKKLSYPEYIISNKQMKLTPDPEKADSLFLYYLFSSPVKQKEILNSGIGAAVPGFNLGQLKNHIVKLPGIADQKKIASYLGLLDQKIDRNHQINQTLEQISQAIFKSWFVDFEPVKAKEHIRKLGGSSDQIEKAAQAIISGAVNLEDILKGSDLSDINGKIESKLEAKLVFQTDDQKKELIETAKLFPDRFVESELGLIPEGWECSAIGKEVNIVGGGTPRTKNKDYWENGTINWTTPKDLSKLPDKILLDTDRKITKKGLSKISSGLLPINTVLLSSRAPVGYLSLTKIPVAINQGYIAMKCEKDLMPEFVLQWANSIMDEIKQRASGTTFAEISKKNFRLIPILVPSKELIESFSSFGRDIYDRISKNASEANTLGDLRDTLLPKLLSGEISV